MKCSILLYYINNYREEKLQIYVSVYWIQIEISQEVYFV